MLATILFSIVIAGLAGAQDNSGSAKNFERFRYFTQELLAGVKEISSEARHEWWKSHEIPTSPVYYSMPAAMANPDTSILKNRALENRLYKNPLAYGKGSFDDVSLLGNRKAYEEICGSKTNDSQVSVVQSSFLPNAIKELNPKNGGIKTKFLGVAGTHHWGMALREVNKMNAGQRNGYPREALLQALAQQILEDETKAPAAETSDEILKSGTAQ